jgi:uncharacterized protein (TIGR03382 family)
MKQFVLAACAVALLAGERAQACGSCAEPFASNAFAFRREPLPSNARVFVSGAVETSSIAVVGSVDDEAVEVPFEVTPAGTADGSVYVSFTWTAAPGTVTITSNIGGQTYSVGTSSDVVAADALDVAVTEGGRGDACCPNVATTLTPTGAIDNDATTPQVLVVLLSSAAGERVVHLPYLAGVGAALGASSEGCLQNDPLAVDGEEVQALVSTIDWAGNESASTPVTFVYRAGTPFGCGFGDDELDLFGCTQTGTSAWASLAVLALLRRRRMNP